MLLSFWQKAFPILEGFIDIDLYLKERFLSVTCVTYPELRGVLEEDIHWVIIV